MTLREKFDNAQICVNGHVANSAMQDFPEFDQEFCNRCGEPTITQCPGCEALIRGAYRQEYALEYEIPVFCSGCGEPYPWTRSKLLAAHELARELDNLNDEERALLEWCIDNLVIESASTTLAVRRFKRLVLKEEEDIVTSFRHILEDITPKTAKKMLWSS